MKTVKINYFGGGIANDYTRGGSGECSMCKHFDIFGYPFRLQPLRGMTNSGEPSDSALKNIILGHDGIMYGVGDDPDNAGKSELYKRTGFGGSDVWTDFSTDQISSAASTVITASFLVHFPEMGAARKLFWASSNLLMATSTADGLAIDTDALTFTTIGQGLVHPSDKVLYFPYQTSTATLIGKISSHATDPFGTVNYTALTLPVRYRAYCLSYFGDFLAVPLTIPSMSGNPQQSQVALWDRDTSLATISQIIPWSDGSLKVLNNLDGVLIGISVLSGEGGAGSTDTDKIVIKAYQGGAGPVVIKEITATRLTSTTPSCAINERVNFIHNGRLYFSANVVNGTSAANYYGLWSVGRNKQGQWTVTMERIATNDNSETGVLAAAYFGDFLSCVHTTAGTLSYTNASSTLSTIYGATSVYESVINPEMPDADKDLKKKIMSVYCTYLPLPAAASVVMQYRVDSNLSGAWTTIFTETTDSEVCTEMTTITDGTPFTDGRKYEFRITSTGGGIITGFGYKYENLDTQLD